MYTLETLGSRFGHFIANDKLRFAVNGFTLPVCPYLGCAGVFIHSLTSILAEKMCSKLRFLEIEFDNQLAKEL